MRLPKDLEAKVLAASVPAKTAPARSVSLFAADLGQAFDRVHAGVATFTLPPSMNNLYRNVPGRGRVKTREYLDWISANRGTAEAMKPPASYPVRMCFRLCGKVYRARDGYNCEKPLTDLLVAEKVLIGDNLNHIVGGYWEFLPSNDPPSVVVWLEEVEV